MRGAARGPKPRIRFSQACPAQAGGLGYPLEDVVNRFSVFYLFYLFAITVCTVRVVDVRRPGLGSVASES